MVDIANERPEDPSVGVDVRVALKHLQKKTSISVLTKKIKIAQDYVDLVTYFQSVKFRGRYVPACDYPTWRLVVAIKFIIVILGADCLPNGKGKFYEMVSIEETKLQS